MRATWAPSVSARAPGRTTPRWRDRGKRSRRFVSSLLFRRLLNRSRAHGWPVTEEPVREGPHGARPWSAERPESVPQNRLIESELVPVRWHGCAFALVAGVDRQEDDRLRCGSEFAQSGQGSTRLTRRRGRQLWPPSGGRTFGWNWEKLGEKPGVVMVRMIPSKQRMRTRAGNHAPGRAVPDFSRTDRAAEGLFLSTYQRLLSRPRCRTCSPESRPCRCPSNRPPNWSIC